MPRSTVAVFFPTRRPAVSALCFGATAAAPSPPPAPPAAAAASPPKASMEMPASPPPYCHCSAALLLPLVGAFARRPAPPGLLGPTAMASSTPFLVALLFDLPIVRSLRWCIGLSSREMKKQTFFSGKKKWVSCQKDHPTEDFPFSPKPNNGVGVEFLTTALLPATAQPQNSRSDRNTTMAPMDAEKRARLQAILEAEDAKSSLAQKVRAIAVAPSIFVRKSPNKVGILVLAFSLF
jgi:hypothetical protein